MELANVVILNYSCEVQSPYILLAYLLEVGVNFFNGNSESYYAGYQRYICYHKFICLMGKTIGCCL